MGMGWLKIIMKGCNRLELEWNGWEEMRMVEGLAWIVARTVVDGLEKNGWDSRELRMGLGESGTFHKNQLASSMFPVLHPPRIPTDGRVWMSFILHRWPATWQNQPSPVDSI